MTESRTDNASLNSPDRYSVCGLIVLTYPQNLSTVKQTLVTMPGVDIHCSDNTGKLVLTIEDVHQSPPIPQQIDRIRDLPGVVDISLAFSHIE